MNTCVFLAIGEAAAQFAAAWSGSEGLPSVVGEYWRHPRQAILRCLEANREAIVEYRRRTALGSLGAAHEEYESNFDRIAVIVGSMGCAYAVGACAHALGINIHCCDHVQW